MASTQATTTGPEPAAFPNLFSALAALCQTVSNLVLAFPDLPILRLPLATLPTCTTFSPSPYALHAPFDTQNPCAFIFRAAFSTTRPVSRTAAPSSPRCSRHLLIIASRPTAIPVLPWLRHHLGPSARQKRHTRLQQRAKIPSTAPALHGGIRSHLCSPATVDPHLQYKPSTPNPQRQDTVSSTGGFIFSFARVMLLGIG